MSGSKEYDKKQGDKPFLLSIGEKLSLASMLLRMQIVAKFRRGQKGEHCEISEINEK